nr:hypothetical protein [Tanacetum cinerariifolium]
MVNMHHEKDLKASSSKGAESPTNDADNDGNENGARVREVDLLRNKNKEAKETKRKLDFIDRDAKKPKKDQNQKSGGTQVKAP